MVGLLRDEALAVLSDVDWLSLFGRVRQKHLDRVDGKTSSVLGCEAPEEVTDVL